MNARSRRSLSGRWGVLALVGTVSALLLSGCPTTGALGNLTFEQRNDGLYDRTLDGEAGDGFLREGIWAIGSYLSIEVDTADGGPLPNLDCYSEDQAVFATSMVGANFIDMDVVGEGISIAIQCDDADTGELIDFISMNAGAPASLIGWHRLPLIAERLMVDTTGVPIQMLEGGAIDIGLEIVDSSGDHLRGNVLADILSTDSLVADLVCDTSINDLCEANQFWVLLAGVPGLADVSATLTGQSATTTLLVDVYGEADLVGVDATLWDLSGNPILTSAAGDGALLVANGLLADSSAVWGGEFTFTNMTPTIIDLVDVSTPQSYAKSIDVLSPGMATVVITLDGSLLPGVQIDFPVVE